MRLPSKGGVKVLIATVSSPPVVRVPAPRARSHQSDSREQDRRTTNQTRHAVIPKCAMEVCDLAVRLSASSSAAATVAADAWAPPSCLRSLESSRRCPGSQVATTPSTGACAVCSTLSALRSAVVLVWPSRPSTRAPVAERGGHRAVGVLGQRRGVDDDVVEVPAQQLQHPLRPLVAHSSRRTDGTGPDGSSAKPDCGTSISDSDRSC